MLGIKWLECSPCLHRALRLVGNTDKNKWAIATQTGYIYEAGSTPAWKVAVKKVFLEEVAP